MRVLEKESKSSKGKKIAPKKQKSAANDLVRKKKVRASERDAAEDDNSEDGLTPASPEQLELEVHSVDGREMTVPFYSQFDMDAHHDSRRAGRELFRLLVSPLPLDKFFE